MACGYVLDGTVKEVMIPVYKYANFSNYYSLRRIQWNITNIHNVLKSDTKAIN